MSGESEKVGADEVPLAEKLPTHCPRVDLRTTEWTHVYNDFVRANKPCIVVNAGVEQWRSSREWSLSGGIAFDSLKSIFPDSICSVQNVKSNQCFDMRLVDFLADWQQARDRGTNPPLRYLKDWHIVRDKPQYCAYETPLPFKNDWLNAWWTCGGRSRWAEKMQDKSLRKKSDYRFCYIGCEGTWTALHHDVYESFSWSANIVGRKRWYMFPPSETSKLYHKRFKDRLVEDCRPGHYCEELFPGVSSAHQLEVVQMPGEVVFVPSGWHHQVHNLDDCCSINHNWFNEACIDRVWRYVHGKFQATVHTIQHLRECMAEREFYDQVSIIMRADAGICPHEFVAMLEWLWEEWLGKNVPELNAFFLKEAKWSLQLVCDQIQEVWVPNVVESVCLS